MKNDRIREEFIKDFDNDKKNIFGEITDKLKKCFSKIFLSSIDELASDCDFKRDIKIYIDGFQHIFELKDRLEQFLNLNNSDDNNNNDYDLAKSNLINNCRC